MIPDYDIVSEGGEIVSFVSFIDRLQTYLHDCYLLQFHRIKEKILSIQGDVRATSGRLNNHESNRNWFGVFVPESVPVLKMREPK